MNSRPNEIVARRPPSDIPKPLPDMTFHISLLFHNERTADPVYVQSLIVSSRVMTVVKEVDLPEMLLLMTVVGLVLNECGIGRMCMFKNGTDLIAPKRRGALDLQPLWFPTREGFDCSWCSCWAKHAYIQPANSGCGSWNVAWIRLWISST